jgi:hypothetical protein
VAVLCHLCVFFLSGYHSPLLSLSHTTMGKRRTRTERKQSNGVEETRRKGSRPEQGALGSASSLCCLVLVLLVGFSTRAWHHVLTTGEKD